MSDVVDQAVAALNARLGDGGFDGSLKFVISGEGAIMLDSAGARADDEDADCTLTADAETFEGILSGDIDATQAFMSGKLALDGDMSTAMKLGAALS